MVSFPKTSKDRISSDQKSSKNFLFLSPLGICSSISRLDLLQLDAWKKYLKNLPNGGLIVIHIP